MSAGADFSHAFDQNEICQVDLGNDMADGSFVSAVAAYFTYADGPQSKATNPNVDLQRGGVVSLYSDNKRVIRVQVAMNVHRPDGSTQVLTGDSGASKLGKGLVREGWSIAPSAEFSVDDARAPRPRPIQARRHGLAGVVTTVKVIVANQWTNDKLGVSVFAWDGSTLNGPILLGDVPAGETNMNVNLLPGSNPILEASFLWSESIGGQTVQRAIIAQNTSPARNNQIVLRWSDARSVDSRLPAGHEYTLAAFSTT